jgi:ATP-dependent Lon protease
MSADDDDIFDFPDGFEDIVSTGAAADSAGSDARLKGLPRLLRYAALVVCQSDHIEHRLVAEIEELCPQLPHNATWAEAQDAEIGLALASELDHRAVVNNDAELRGLADCVRLLSLPMPRDATYFEEHRRVGKALIHAFRSASRNIEESLRCNLEGFVFAWAALPSCTGFVTPSLRAVSNATILAPLIYTHSVEAARSKVWREVEKREEFRRKKEESAITQFAEAQQASTAEAVQSPSLVVARLSEVEMKNPKLKEILGPFKGVVNEALPLIKAPPLQQVRSKLLFEFPYAANVVDFALTDLVGRTTARLRPLLIVGNPGGGKSRFARRLGEELGLGAWRTDASQCDGAVFGGTSRRWYSAEPCHPFLAVARGKIANPLVVIDEIEKAATRADYGRLWDCLLAFLESETSARYPDPALQTNIDLSQVSYIATANRLDSLPWPIRDRFRVVMFPNPTAEYLDSLVPAVMEDIAKERNLDRMWFAPLDGNERAAVQRLWQGGSIRYLRRTIEAVLRTRDLFASAH